jgi:hypothetical protein
MAVHWRLASGVGGDVINDATFNNSSTVSGLVTNGAGATFNQTAGSVGGGVTNAGTVTDDLSNAGTVTNSGTYNANVASNTGTITNSLESPMSAPSMAT